MTSCYLLYSLCTIQYIQQSSGVLVVFATAMVVASEVDAGTADELKAALAGLWVFCEVFLFTTTGANIALKNTNGPLQSDNGISRSEIASIFKILAAGTFGRLGGIILAQVLCFFQLKPHRREFRYMATWILTTWIFQIPKATAQATLGGLPFSLHLIPGTSGLQQGVFIQQGSAFSILIMATIGICLTKLVGMPLAQYWRDLDGITAQQKADSAVKKIELGDKTGPKTNYEVIESNDKDQLPEDQTSDNGDGVIIEAIDAQDEADDSKRL